MNCFSMALSTGYKPSGIDFLVWVPHGPQVLLVNQLLDWTPQASFRACLPGPAEFPMGCSGDICSTLSSRWTKRKTTLHRDLLNLMRFSKAQFSSLSISTALLHFMPSAHLMMSSDHLSLPHLAMHFFLTPQFEEEILAQSCHFPACLI